VPIIALTASAMSADRERCLQELEMNDHLAKPVRIAELSAMLARWAPGNAEPIATGQFWTSGAGLRWLVCSDRAGLISWGRSSIASRRTRRARLDAPACALLGRARCVRHHSVRPRPEG